MSKRKPDRDAKQRRFERLSLASRPYLNKIHSRLERTLRVVLARLKQEPIELIAFVLGRASQDLITKAQVTESAFPRSYVAPAQPLSARPSQLIEELNWNACVLCLYANELNDFETLRTRFECELISHNESKAREVYGVIVERFGQSLWALESGILLEETFRGIVGTEEFVERLELNSPGSFFTGIGSVVRQRSEAGVSARYYDSYVSQTLSMVDEQADSYFSYIRYIAHPASQDVNDDRALMATLRFSATTSLVDRYVAFMRAIVIVHVRSKSPPTQQLDTVVRFASARLSCNELQHLLKLYVPNHGLAESNERDGLMDALSKYTLGDYCSARDRLADLLHAFPYCFDLYGVYCATLSLLDASLPDGLRLPKSAMEVLSSVYAVTVRAIDASRALDALEKAAYSYARTRFGDQIMAFVIANRDSVAL